MDEYEGDVELAATRAPARRYTVCRRGDKDVIKVTISRCCEMREG